VRSRQGAKGPIDANQTSVIQSKRAEPPLIEQFYVAVDRQLKSGFGTSDAAEKAALVIKSRYPHLQVAVYDPQKGQYTTIEQARPSTDPGRAASLGTGSAFKQPVAAGVRH